MSMSMLMSMEVVGWDCALQGVTKIAGGVLFRSFSSKLKTVGVNEGRNEGAAGVLGGVFGVNASGIARGRAEGIRGRDPRPDLQQ